jgi:hypothetical protein
VIWLAFGDFLLDGFLPRFCEPALKYSPATQFNELVCGVGILVLWFVLIGVTNLKATIGVDALYDY